MIEYINSCTWMPWTDLQGILLNHTTLQLLIKCNSDFYLTFPSAFPFPIQLVRIAWKIILFCLSFNLPHKNSSRFARTKHPSVFSFFCLGRKSKMIPPFPSREIITQKGYLQNLVLAGISSYVWFWGLWGFCSPMRLLPPTLQISWESAHRQCFAACPSALEK